MIEKYISIPVEKLVKANWNYKEDDEALLAKLVENIKRNGQIENIIVRELDTGFYEVVNGNHRYDALCVIGAKEVVCFNLGKISDAQARRIAVETNETRFGTDNVRLAEVLKEINDEFGLSELAKTMPFDEEEIQHHINLLDFDWEQYEGGDAGDGTGDNAEDDAKSIEEIVCPHCQHVVRLRAGEVVEDDGA